MQKKYSKPKILSKKFPKEQEVGFCSRGHGGKSLYYKKESATQSKLKKAVKSI